VQACDPEVLGEEMWENTSDEYWSTVLGSGNPVLSVRTNIIREENRIRDEGARASGVGAPTTIIVDQKNK
jgi:hypothetical protein